MSTDIFLPTGTVKLFQRAGETKRHPGLLLDKFSPPGDQKKQREAIKKICSITGDSDLLHSILRRRNCMLQAANAKHFSARTTGPLTLHLARASALENAGIHLHPVYGFACLPGSGLKGMARAYAETIWLTGQLNKQQAWKNILDVFGWSPGIDSGKTWKPDSAETPAGSNTGAVIFHEAWPTKWPRLEPDIANIHHKEYYGDNGEPGDWESPTPVYFLSVSPNTTFAFAVSPRGPSDEALSDLACEWLQSALVQEGAGAKTHAGYGRFRLVDLPKPAPSPQRARAISRHSLELVTPAFLAGAEQEESDCDLRPGTLRGLLRWWWRTMHVAHLKTDDLRRLETAIWGNTEQGAALALSVVREESNPAPALYDKQQIEQEFLQPTDRRTTQGLFYASYGMDEKKQGKREQRHYVAPGAAWNVTLSARKSVLDDLPIEASEILRQGEAALWLLCHYGGVGSKARKGFGSFADISIDGIGNIEDSKRIGEKLRQKLRLKSSAGSKACSSLDDMLDILEIDTPWRDYWFALDQLGLAAQRFAQKYKHKKRKAALGLPRKIHGPTHRPFGHQNRDSHQPPKTLHNEKGDTRHASPVHYHLARAEDNTLTIRIMAFPSSVLPDPTTSVEMLKKLREHVSTEIKKSASKYADKGQKPVERTQSASVAALAGIDFPKPNDRVRATLLEEKTKKGGWKARHNDSGLAGVIQNSKEVPEESSPGQHVELIVAYCTPNEPNKDSRIAFRWPGHEQDKPHQGATQGGGRRDGRNRRKRT